MRRPSHHRSDRWNRIDRVFEAALDRPPEERAAFLAETCGDDTDMLREIRQLLSISGPAEDYWRDSGEPLLERVRAEVACGAESTASSREDLHHIGPYRLLHSIGRGGMGTVYLGERDDGEFEQHVAVKLLRRGLDTDDVVHRFQTERQILASLTHPNIARLLDGGTTEEGRPYLVMEYVEG